MVTTSALPTVSSSPKASFLLLVIHGIGLFLLLFLSSCETTSSDSDTFYTRPYYFPIEELAAGQVYEYHNIQDETSYLSHFWHLTSTVEGSDTFLIWKRYNPLFEQDQYIKEQIFKDGAVVKEYYLYVYDSVQQQRRAYPVEQTAIFPFQAATDPNMVYRYSASMTLPPDFVTVRLNRDRRFVGAVPKPFQLEDQSLQTIVFQSKDLYDIEDTTQGGFWNDERHVREYYAAGIGLVETQESGTGPSALNPKITRLVKRHNVPAFDRLRQAAIKLSE